MNRWAQLCLISGVIFSLFGVLSYLLGGPSAEVIMAVHLGLGVVLIVTWLLFGGRGGIGTVQKFFAHRSSQVRLGTVTATAFVVALLAALNVAALRWNYRVDLTEAKVFSLSDASRKTLARLSEPLKIVALTGVRKSSSEGKAHELLEMYRRQNPKSVTTQYINVLARPEAMHELEMKSGEVLYLEYGSPADKKTTRLGEISEAAVTSALVALLEDTTPVIYVLQGHGEPELESDAPSGMKKFALSLKNSHHEVKELVLIERSAIPDDAKSVLLVSPRQPIPANEKELLKTYVQKGGSLLMLTDPRGSSDVAEMAKQFGIEVREDLVLDPGEQPLATTQLGAYVVARDYGTHAITRALPARQATVFRIASSLGLTGDHPAQAQYAELVKTGSRAWAKSDLAKIFMEEQGTLSPEESDTKGPLVLGYAAQFAGSGEAGQGVSRVVVFSDSDWILNSSFDLYGNRDLALASAEWLSRKTAEITLPAKGMRRSLVLISHEMFVLILITSFILPELVLLFGLVVWWRRRWAVP